MYRTLTVVVILIACVLPAPCASAEPPTLKTGEDLKVELTKDTPLTFIGWYDAEFANGKRDKTTLRNQADYATELAIALKAGQDLTVTVGSTGKQSVAVVLLDPTGKPVSGTELRPNRTKTTFEKVSASGTYRLIVASDRIGELTVRATGPSAAELDVKALEEKIVKLKRELAETEAKLKALKAKKKP